MGTGLADAAGVLKLVNGAPATHRDSGNPETELADDRLWQTPPLWGVALSAPYLHDGRAKDLHTAITMHAGEAANSAKNYKELAREQKKQLLAFLATLGDGVNVSPFGSRSSQVGVASGGWSSSSQPPQGMLASRRRRSTR